MQNLPIFNYTQTKPNVSRGVEQSQVRFQPQGWFSGGANSGPNQYIRFDFQTDGFWDPKQTYIYIEVDTSSMPANTIYQLDNSAQSFISQFIARVKGSEIERIQEYDGLAAMLYDMNIGISDRDPMVTQGVGKNRSISAPVTSRGGNGSITGTLTGTTFSSAIVNSVSTSTGIGLGLNCSTYRPFLIGQGPITTSQFLSATTYDTIESQGSGLIEVNDLWNCDDTEGWDTYYMDQLNTVQYFNSVGTHFLAATDYGVARPKTDASVGGGEQWFSNSYLRHTVKSGLACYEVPNYSSFCIPLLSSIFGPLSEHGKLLPMELLGGLEFEFLLNQYAFFAVGATTAARNTSSFNIDLLNNDGTIASTTPPIVSRTGWKITKFEIVTEITRLPAAETQSILSQGVDLTVKQWYLGPKIKNSGNDSLNSTIQINNGFSSLCMLAFYFQPADYEVYPWCRKHKRISQNLTQLQLRVGQMYYPSLPISGHAGNIRPDTLAGRGSYVEFFVNTMKAFGKWFNPDENTLLNPTNFTANSVGYNPTYMTSEIPGTSTSGVNTHLSMPLFWENTVIPRCIYAIDLEKFDLLGSSFESGMDSSILRPFDLLLQNDNGSVNVVQRGSTNPSAVGSTTSTTLTNVAFPRPYYIYIWMYHDANLRFQNGAWSLTGRI